MSRHNLRLGSRPALGLLLLSAGALASDSCIDGASQYGTAPQGAIACQFASGECPDDPYHLGRYERFRTVFRRWSWKKNTGHADLLYRPSPPYWEPGFGYHETQWRRGEAAFDGYTCPPVEAEIIHLPPTQMLDDSQVLEPVPPQPIPEAKPQYSPPSLQPELPAPAEPEAIPGSPRPDGGATRPVATPAPVTAPLGNAAQRPSEVNAAADVKTDALEYPTVENSKGAEQRDDFADEATATVSSSHEMTGARRSEPVVRAAYDSAKPAASNEVFLPPALIGALTEEEFLPPLIVQASLMEHELEDSAPESDNDCVKQQPERQGQRSAPAAPEIEPTEFQIPTPVKSRQAPPQPSASASDESAVWKAKHSHATSPARRRRAPAAPVTQGPDNAADSPLLPLDTVFSEQLPEPHSCRTAISL